MQHPKSFIATLAFLAIMVALISGCGEDERRKFRENVLAADKAEIELAPTASPRTVAAEEIVIDEIAHGNKVIVRMIDSRYKQYCIRNKSGGSRNWSCSPL